MSGRQRHAPALRLDGLSVDSLVDGRAIVEDVSLEISQGETLCLVGESGSGKSMTARALMGVCPPGLRLRTRALAVGGIHGAQVGRMALVPQRALSALNPLLRIRTQMIESYVGRGLGSAGVAEARAVHLLSEVGIDMPGRRLRQYPHELSGGQCQRILIAMALMCSPAVLIADEPTTALDASTQLQVLMLLKRLGSSAGLGLLLITHDLAVAAMAADRVAVMYAGQIVEVGPARQVLASPLHPYTQALLACTPDIIPGRFGELPRPIAGAMLPRGLDAPGCPFASRCDVALPMCSNAVIPVFDRPDGHRARCVRL